MTHARSRVWPAFIAALIAALALALIPSIDSGSSVSQEPLDLTEVEEANHTSFIGPKYLSHKWWDGPLYIQRGTNYPSVKLIQALLNRMGYHTYSMPNCSGKFIDHTSGIWNWCDEQAIKAFQRTHGGSTKYGGEYGNVGDYTFWKLQGAQYNHLAAWSTYSYDVCRGWHTPVHAHTHCHWRADSHHAPRNYKLPTYYDYKTSRWSYWDHVRGIWIGA